jgi:DNA-binding CsgD family transcriptional regulator
MRDLLAGAGFAVILAVQAYAVADSWGGRYWVFGCVAGALVCGLALVRRRWWAAGAGLAVAAGAAVVTRVAHLPSEPGLAMTLGLAVLTGSAVRTRPPTQAGLVAAGGLVVVLAGWLAGFSAGGTVNAAGWLGAVAGGLGLRQLDARHAAAIEAIEAIRDDERPAPSTRRAHPLSDRESEVARAIARARTNQEIAAELFISLSTVKTHVAAIQRKLGMRNRVEIAVWAWENDLVAEPS